jgi:hypothetical protein
MRETTYILGIKSIKIDKKKGCLDYLNPHI